jgi:putative protein-disulfide isomerase
VQQLRVTGFPTVFLQVSDKKFYLLSQGYADYPTLKNILDKTLSEIALR